MMSVKLKVQKNEHILADFEEAARSKKLEEDRMNLIGQQLLTVKPAKDETELALQNMLQGVGNYWAKERKDTMTSKNSASKQRKREKSKSKNKRPKT